MAYRGKFRPQNPSKYQGDPSNIIYRSSWELKLMRYLDTHKDIIGWASEELAIKYISPIDNKYHRYYVDFVVHKRLPDGTKETILIEVKPHVQTMQPPPRKPGQKITRSHIRLIKQWGVNDAKWKAARAFCDERGYKFQIMTEKELGIPTGKKKQING
jgi:hypothetical protein